MAGRGLLRIMLVAVALFPGAAALAQRTESELTEKPDKVFGSYYVYEAPEAALPKPPRGYKPFYISHLGRHGARYALTHYDVVMAGLDTARALGLLSTGGEEFYSRYKAFYAVAGGHEGELTEKGAAQQRGIARRMFGRFPAVFRGKTSLVAVSTTVPRVVRSMEAFLSEMEGLDRSISVKSESSIEHQRYIDPTERKNPGAYPRRDVAAAVKASNERFVSRMDWKGFAGRLFTSPEEFEKHFDKFSFELCVYRFVQSLPCLDEENPGFDSLFTWRQLRNLFFADNYRSYVTDGMCPQNNCLRPLVTYVLLDEMIRSADSDMAGGPQLRLRFSHDSALMPLLSLMDVNGMGYATANPDAVADRWRLFDIPMGCSLQLVFCRSRRNPQILVMPLLNESPASLPFPSVEGPYYSWQDFKDYYEKIVDDARAALGGWDVPRPESR